MNSKAEHTEIVLKNASFEMLETHFKFVAFPGFALGMFLSFGFEATGILHGILIFLYVGGFVVLVMFLNYFFTVTRLDEKGISQKSFTGSKSLLWKEIKSVNVQLITGKFISDLKKEEFREDFIIGKKEILVSCLEDQLLQSSRDKRKSIIYLPYQENVVEVLIKKQLL